MTQPATPPPGASRPRLAAPVLALLALVGGCPGERDPGGPDPGGYDAGFPSALPPDTVRIDPDRLVEFSSCYVQSLQFSEARMVAATEALRDLSDGTTDTVITDEGCVHFLREIVGGELASAEFRAFTGEFVYAVDGAEVLIGARFVTLARWERGADGTLRGRIDNDDDAFAVGDDFAEVQTEERPGYYRSTRYNPASRLVEWQLTQDRSATPPLQTTEELVDGALTTIDRTIIDLGSELQCDDPALDCWNRRTECTPEQTANLENSMALALARGSSCMAPLASSPGPVSDVWVRLQAMKNLWTERHAWACMPAGCSCAHWCEECGDARVNVIDIGYDDWTTRAREAQLGTLFHELLHGVLGAHTDVVSNGTFPPGRTGTLMRRYVDRVGACEAYCFAATPTRCACATCLQARTCDAPCGGLTSCTEWDTSASGGTTALMSEAVGAACVTLNAAGEEQSDWFATLADCRAAGCESRGECRSYSRSCEPGCE